MIVVTNNKVAGFQPVWADFRGISFLFDNPGASLRRSGEVQEICCNSRARDSLVFYDKLQAAISQVGDRLLTNTYLFCPLPVSSYHVTVCDGINRDNLDVVESAHRGAIDAFLRGLPSSLRSMPNALIAIASSHAVVQPIQKITFGFKKLTIWGNKVMVARLESADPESQRSLDGLKERRSLLCKQFHEVFGIPMPRGYSPHVSLGYFANVEHGELALARLTEWIREFKKIVGEATISFESLALYGFTDMATFFK